MLLMDMRRPKLTSLLSGLLVGLSISSNVASCDPRRFVAGEPLLILISDCGRKWNRGGRALGEFMHGE